MFLHCLKIIIFAVPVHSKGRSGKRDGLPHSVIGRAFPCLSIPKSRNRVAGDATRRNIKTINNPSPERRSLPAPRNRHGRIPHEAFKLNLSFNRNQRYGLRRHLHHFIKIDVRLLISPAVYKDVTLLHRNPPQLLTVPFTWHPSDSPSPLIRPLPRSFSLWSWNLPFKQFPPDGFHE